MITAVTVYHSGSTYQKSIIDVLDGFRWIYNDSSTRWPSSKMQLQEHCSRTDEFLLVRSCGLCVDRTHALNLEFAIKMRMAVRTWSKLTGMASPNVI